MRIAVYCSARENLPKEMHKGAHLLGRWIGRNDHTLVYGGLSYGLMKIVAEAAGQTGANVIGVVPESRAEKKCSANTETLMCRTLNERKQILEDNADVFVALDGGIVTIGEVFSALATMVFFNTSKPILWKDL